MATASFQRESILFVGRQTLDFELMEGHLRQFGIVCHRVGSAVDALDKLQDSTFDFVILDDTIPDYSAMGFIRELEGGHPNVRLIIMGNPASGNVTRQLERSNAINPVASLSKPIFQLQLDELLMSYRSGAHAMS